MRRKKQDEFTILLEKLKNQHEQEMSEMNKLREQNSLLTTKLSEYRDAVRKCYDPGSHPSVQSNPVQGLLNHVPPVPLVSKSFKSIESTLFPGSNKDNNDVDPPANRMKFAKGLFIRTASLTHAVLPIDRFTESRTVSESKLEEEPRWHMLDRFVVPHNRIWRKAWDCVVLFLLLYVATVFPMRLAFWENRIVLDSDEEMHQTATAATIWTIIQIAVDALFWLDLFFHFVFSYEDETGKEVDNIRMIILRYVKGQFLVDLLACLPADALATKFNTILRFSRAPRLIRTIRVVRLSRLSKIMKFGAKSDLYQALQRMRMVRLGVLAFILLLVCHILACGWYICAALHADPSQTWVFRRAVDAEGLVPLYERGPWEQWLHAMYFVLTVFTTVGFGDMSAMTTGELVYVSGILIAGTIVNGIITSNMITVVTSADEGDADRQSAAMLVDQFGKQTSLDEETSYNLKRWVQQNFQRIPEKFDTNEARNLLTSPLLPREIFEKLPSAMYGGRLVNNKFISLCKTGYNAKIPARLPILMALESTWRCYSVGDIVHYRGDLAFGIFFVTKGLFAATAEVRSMDVSRSDHDDFDNWHGTYPPNNSLGQEDEDDTNVYPFYLYGVNSYFGALELLCNLGTTKSTVRCEVDGDCLMLPLASFKRLIEEDFPTFVRTWKRDALHKDVRRRRMQSRLLQGAPYYTYKHLAASVVQDQWRCRNDIKKRPSKSDFAGAIVDAMTSGGDSIPVMRFNPGTSSRNAGHPARQKESVIAM